MPIDPQNTAQIRDRELRVWDLLLKGLEGIDIARREGVHPSVISRIKTRVERRIIAETDGKAASLRLGRLAKFGAHGGRRGAAGRSRVSRPRRRRGGPQARAVRAI